MTDRCLLSDILRTIDNNASFGELFTEEQLTKYRKIAARLSENPAERPFRVVFCGVFSSGKTSLINSVLSAEFQLPQGVNPVTKLVTRIDGGEEVACAYRLNGNKTPIPKDYITALIQGKKQLIFDSHELMVTIPSDLLKHHVELLDTPGFNDEMGGELERMSREAIYEADMAVMCCNSLQLGKIFERELLQELDELMGHFSLVVTRMDNLNTTEDCNAVIEQANRLMLHKGNDAAVFATEQPFVFPVVTAGAQKHTREFKNYLKAILSDDGMKRQIQEMSDHKCLARCLNEIQPILAEQSLALRTELAALAKKNQESVKQQEWAAQCEINNLMTRHNEARTAAAQMAEQRMRWFAEVVRTMQNPHTFAGQANQLANAVVNDFINDIAAYGQQMHLSDGSAVKNALCRGYLARDFSVPPPTTQKVKKRSGFRRLFTTLGNFLRFRFVIDDGCEEVYNNYHDPAIWAVRQGPIEWILQDWSAYLDQLRSGWKMPVFSGGCEDTIREKQALLTQCEGVLSRIRDNC